MPATDQGLSFEVSDFGPPFDRESANVIIRSKDNVDFRASRAILVEASEFFQDLFIHATVDDARDDLPIVKVEEQRNTVEALLRLIYPMDNPIVTDIWGIEALIRALDKYLITTYPRFVESLLKDAMSRSPHLVFAIAFKYDMPQIADDAALETLRRPLFFAEGYTDTRRLFTIISRERFTRLMQYHFECVSENCAVLRGMEVTTNPPESSTPCSEHLPCVLYLPTTPRADSESAEVWANSCRCARQTGMEHAASGTRSFTVPVWVVNFMRKCRTLLGDRPHWETLTKEGVDDQLMAPF